MLTRLITNPGLRAFARKTGLLALARRFRRSDEAYERKFWDALLAAIRPGDCVWDVGANEGLYALKFSALVGPAGSVQAFEPFGTTHDRLVANIRAVACTNVHAHRLALGQADEEVTAAVTDEAGGVTNSLAGPGMSATGTEMVSVRRGDGLAGRAIPTPNILKIDVEAFEGEVLDGLKATISRVECRAVFCEIHFSKLEQRGRRDAPRQIEQLLRSAGFRVDWIDASHLGARRPNP